MRELKCSEIWGGNRETNTDLCTSALTASLFSSSASGGKGGDIYYFSVCGNDMICRIAIADVVGHGHMVSDTSRWLYDSLARRMNGVEGKKVLNDLNVLAKKHSSNAITTAEVITFNKVDSKLHFSYAGHPPILFKPKNEVDWQSVTIQKPSKTDNIPLGILEDASFDEEIISLRSGDVLFLYTDGVIEARRNGNQLFGLDRLLYVLKQNGNNPPNKIKEAVLDALFKFSGETFNHDDVTLMVIKVN